MPSIESLFYQYWKITLAIILSAVLLYGQIRYFLSLSKKKVKPTFLSWLGWAILMGISFWAQVDTQGWTIKVTALLVSTVGCLIIGLSAWLVFRHYSFTPGDLKYLGLGLLCMTLYLVSKNEWITTIVAIAADAILAIPSIRNGIKNPGNERSEAWILALIAWTLNLVIVFFHFSWLHMLWPLYLIAFNGTMTFLNFIRPRFIKKQ